MKEHGLISANDENAWAALLSQCVEFDTYHTAAYHRIYERLGQGLAYLFYYRNSERIACIPLIFRDVVSSHHQDATSVYGYPGAITSLRQPDAAFAAEFQDALRNALLSRRVVTVFSRLHPLIQTGWLLQDMSDIGNHGLTVWLDLTRSEEAQMAMVSKDHRRNLRKALGHGFIFREDVRFERLPEFIEMYEMTMRRNCASAHYFFPHEYYSWLQSELAGTAKLFVAELHGKVVSGTILLATGRYLHYHLSGTPEEYLEYNCTRFLLNAIRQWGSTRGYVWLNLGGGVGAKVDSLFHFKAGFSSLHYPFQTARIIVDSDAYAELVRKHPAAGAMGGDSDAFFPAYRRSEI
jgi:hypothetical protein